MKTIRGSVLATVLAGLLVPAGVAIAVGEVRASFREDRTATTPAIERPAHPGVEKPSQPKTDSKPKAGPEPAKDLTPPSLLLLSPERGAHVSEPVVTVKGAAETGSTVKVNGERVVLDDHGRFARDVKLQPGRNLIVIKAYDAAGNRSTLDLAVYYDTPLLEPKPELTEKPEADLKDFTVHQRFGSSSTDPPTDVFYGTGTPGQTVKVKSEYGYAYATVGKDGTWEAVLVFEGLERGKTIPVWIKLDGMLVREFEFTFVH